MWVKEENEKAGLKFNIQKTKMMASGSITLWQIEGVKVRAVRDFIFLNSKVTADGDCSHEIIYIKHHEISILKNLMNSKVT